MLLQLSLPHIKSGIDSARVERWLVAEGAEVRAGEDLCELIATSVLMLKRVSSPRLQVTRRHRLQPTRGPGRYLVLVTAAEAAVVRRLVARPGDEVPVGEPLALLSTDLDDELGDDLAGSPLAMRAAVSSVLIDRLG